MSDELVFYTHPMSRGRMIRWMLEEVGATYRSELLDYGTTMKAPDYLAINPMGKVPAITHRGQSITETAAICAYLADVFPEAGLAPPAAQRGAYYRWLFFAAGPLEAAITNRSLGVEVEPRKSGFVGYGSGLDAVLDVVEGALAGHDYIAGPRFTAADLYIGSQLGFFMRFKTIPERPVFRAYVDRLEARPAFVRAAEIDDALMPAKSAS